MRTFTISTILFVSFLGAFGIASPKTHKSLQAVSTKYRNAAVVQMEVERLIKSELTGKDLSYLGKISLSQGLFRMETNEPEKSLIVFDGKFLWHETPASPDFPGPIQVTKAKISSGDQQQVLFATLLSKDPIEKHFQVLKEEKKSELLVYEAKPLSKDLNITSLTLTVNPKIGQITDLSYVDDVGNITQMKFSKIVFKETKTSKLFKYQPPKGSQVTEL